MESTYQTFSPYPSQMQDLVVDGQTVGMHFLDDQRRMYSARIYTSATLPEMFMTNTAGAGHSMAKHPLGLKNSQLWCDAFRFPDELLGLQDVQAFKKAWGDLGRWTSLLREIRVNAHSMELNGAGSIVSLNFGYKKLEDLERLINFAVYIAKNAATLLKRTRTYRDTLEMVGDLDRKEPRPQDIDPILETLNAATGWASGSWNRVSHVLEGRLALKEHGAMHKVKVSCRWEDPLLKSFRLHLEGELPSGSGLAKLTPQPRGIVGFLKSLGEVKLGEKTVDDAYLISADEAAQVFLCTQKSDLDTLSTFTSELFLGDDVLNIHATTGAEQLPALVELTLNLYRRTLLHRLGDP